MNIKAGVLIISYVFMIYLASQKPSMAAEGVDSEAFEALKADCAQWVKRTEGLTVVGDDGWLFSRNELRHISVGEFWGKSANEASRARRADRRDPIPAILDFKEKLDRLGINLIFLPVPPKALIYPHKISESIRARYGEKSPRLDIHHQKFYGILRDKGVNVIDLVTEFMVNRYDEKGYTYCKTDTHWSGLGCVRAAKLLALELKNEVWMKDLQKARFDTEYRTVLIKGDLLRDLQEDKGIEAEELKLRFIRTKTRNGLRPVNPDSESPVILMADSHGLIFHIGGDMLVKGAGLADQLALELGFPVDLIAVRGSGATPARVNLYRRARKKGYLAKKKVVIWCIAAREFTESVDGWAKVPVLKRTNIDRR